MLKKRQTGCSQEGSRSTQRLTVRVLALAVTLVGLAAPGWAQTLTTGVTAIASDSTQNGRLDPSDVIGMTLCLSNSGTTAGDVTGTLLATGGVTSPSGPQSYGTVNPGAVVCRTFTFTVSASCGSTIQVSLQAAIQGGGTPTLNYPPQDVGSPSILETQFFDSITAPALPVGWSTVVLSGAASNPFSTLAFGSDSAPNRAFVANPSVVSDNALVSPVWAIPATGGAVQFRQSYATEANSDGGVLEISIAGGAFADVITAGGSFGAGGYNSTLSSDFGNPIGGRPAWSGSSTGYVTTIVRLPSSAAGQNVQLRWRMGTDNGSEAAGWSIDSVQVYTFLCGAGSVPPPGPLFKSAPTNTALSVSVNPVLSWVPSVGGLSYEYCVDRFVNTTCDTGWVNVGTATSVVLTSLEPGRRYQWQVRAVNGGGATQADIGAFWQMTTAAPTNPLSDVALDFGVPGLWTYYDGAGGAPSFAWLSPLSPSVMTRANLNGNVVADLVVTFPGFGVWAFIDNTLWQRIHPNDATKIEAGDMDGSGRDELVLDFPGAGVWAYYDNNSWVRLHPANAVAIALGNLDGSAGGRADVVISFAGAGTWGYLNNSTWYPLLSADASILEFGDVDANGLGDVIGMFPGLGEGILVNGTTWLGLHALDATNFITGNFDGDVAGSSDLLVVFPGTLGTWVLLNGNNWVRIHAQAASVIATGDVDANGNDDLILGFPGQGLWRLRNLTTWLPLHGLTPEAALGGRFNAN